MKSIDTIEVLPNLRMFPLGQVGFLFALLVGGCALIFLTMFPTYYATSLLYIGISGVGLLLCRKTQVHLKDPRLKILGYLWLIKILFTIFLLYVGWIPDLDPTFSMNWGYDPQRFYFQARELVDNNWIPNFGQLNYTGILYYYGAIYYIVGHNPVIPALINAFVTLLATLCLVRAGYAIKQDRGSRDWTISFALLIPEMLWFDVMTSRETLVAALLVFSLVAVGRYLARLENISLIKTISVVALSVGGISFVRTSMLLPVVLSIILMVLFVRQTGAHRVVLRTLLISVGMAALLFAPLIGEFTGGAKFSSISAIDVATSSAKNIALRSDVQWSDSSIGMLLMPNGILQSVLFLPLRMLLYLSAPLPNILVPLQELLGGSFYAWERLCMILSSVLNLLIFPYAIASLIQAVNERKANPAPLVFHVPYWCVFASIAGGNLIIHERYRIMGTLFLWGCAWLGSVSCPNRLIHKSKFVWYGLLGSCGFFYVTYKFLNII
jgi:hypothetical protein